MSASAVVCGSFSLEPCVSLSCSSFCFQILSSGCSSSLVSCNSLLSLIPEGSPPQSSLTICILSFEFQLFPESLSSISCCFSSGVGLGFLFGNPLLPSVFGLFLCLRCCFLSFLPQFLLTSLDICPLFAEDFLSLPCSFPSPF